MGFRVYALSLGELAKCGVRGKVVVAEDSGLSGRDFVDFRRHRGVGFTVLEGFSVLFQNFRRCQTPHSKAMTF